MGGGHPEVSEESCEVTWTLKGEEEWRAEMEVPAGGRVTCSR